MSQLIFSIHHVLHQHNDGITKEIRIMDSIAHMNGHKSMRDMPMDDPFSLQYPTRFVDLTRSHSLTKHVYVSGLGDGS